MAERYQATYSSTPLSVIYAQSWPVPSVGKAYPEQVASNHRKKLNCPSWIDQLQNRRRTASEQADSRTEKKTHSWAKSMLKTHYPEWVEEDAHVKLDMAKEFKLTLKMFRKLTQQVEEVDEQLKSNRNPYLFKHYSNNQGFPGLYRSQLHLAANERSYTPQPWHHLKEKVMQRRPHSRAEIYSKTYKNYSSEPSFEEAPPNDATCLKRSKIPICQAEQKKAFEKKKLDEKLLQQECDNSELVWSSDEKENDESGYIDPVPSDWSERKLEELEEHFLLGEKDQPDAFLVRYFRLRRLEADTIENEKGCLKSDEIIESSLSQNGSVRATNASKKQLKKSCSNGKNSKSKDEKISRNSEKNFRKCTTFKSDIEFGNSLLKSGLAERENDKEKNQGKNGNSTSKRGKCLSAMVRKDCNSSSQSCKVEHYDIVELASTFEPPSKDRINRKSRPVTAKSATSKGLLPGKSWHSQRRFSLTTCQTPQLISSDSSMGKSKSSKGRQKSAKRKTKRCASSKL